MAAAFGDTGAPFACTEEIKLEKRKMQRAKKSLGKASKSDLLEELRAREHAEQQACSWRPCRVSTLAAWCDQPPWR